MDELRFIKSVQGSIASQQNVAAALRIDEALLDEALNMPSAQRYTPHRIDGDRLVYRPNPLIRKIQRRIKQSILAELITYPRYIYGSIRDENFPRDYISCAQVHCQAKSVLKMDIKKFFDNIEASLVEDIFSRLFAYPDEVSNVLTDICTHEGYVPQGASTSSHIATLCFWSHEPSLVRQLHREGLRYTRLVDDITVSSGLVNFDFTRVKARIRDMVEGRGLSLNENKTIVYHYGVDEIRVHGLRVNYDYPQMPHAEANNIRAAVNQLVKLAKVPNAITSPDYRRLYESVSGRVNKLLRLKHAKYARYRKVLKGIKPMPSRKDLIRCVGLFNGLVQDAQASIDTYSYYVRFHRLQSRLNLVQRIYVAQAKSMRKSISEIKPTFRMKD